MSRDGLVALPRGAMGLSVVCDCFYFLIILTYYLLYLWKGIALIGVLLVNWVGTKKRIKPLAQLQGHNTVPHVSLEPVTP